MFETLESRWLLAVTVTVDGGVQYQTMDGFGSSVRVFDDPHVFENFNPVTKRGDRPQQGEVMDRLYRDLKLTRVRPASPDMGSGIEAVNDNSDASVTDPTKFNFGWKNLDAHADYLTRARARGATTSFLSPLIRESWMGTTTQNDAAEYGEWLMAQDDLAIATDKTALLPGQGAATFANYSSYGRGLNGVMIDIARLPGELSAADFSFKAGNNNSPGGWADAPPPETISRPGRGDRRL